MEGVVHIQHSGGREGPLVLPSETTTNLFETRQFLVITTHVLAVADTTNAGGAWGLDGCVIRKDVMEGLVHALLGGRHEHAPRPLTDT